MHFATAFDRSSCMKGGSNCAIGALRVVPTICGTRLGIMIACIATLTTERNTFKAFCSRSNRRRICGSSLHGLVPDHRLIVLFTMRRSKRSVSMRLFRVPTFPDARLRKTTSTSEVGIPHLNPIFSSHRTQASRRSRTQSSTF